MCYNEVVPEILRKNIRKRQLGKKPAIRRIQVRLNSEWEALFLETKLDLFTLARKKLTRAFILREGGLQFLRQLRVQIAKAKKGHLHAKPRNTLSFGR